MIGGYVRVQSLNIKHQDKSSKMFYIQASIFNLRENDKHFHDDIYCESYSENPRHFHDAIIQVLAKILNILRMAMIMKITEKARNILWQLL